MARRRTPFTEREARKLALPAPMEAIRRASRAARPTATVANSDAGVAVSVSRPLNTAAMAKTIAILATIPSHWKATVWVTYFLLSGTALMSRLLIIMALCPPSWNYKWQMVSCN